jgi:hypothetical protein
MAAVTRLGLHGGPRGLYGAFTGKAAAAVQMSGTTGFVWTPSGALDVAATLAGSTGWDTAPSGALDVAATLAGSTGFSWSPTGNPVGTALSTVQPSGGWDKLSRFDDHLNRKRRQDDERQRLREEIEAIESPVDQEIARLLQAQERKAERHKQLEDLEQLIAVSFTNDDLPKVRDFNERVEKAFVRASVQGNFSAVEAFEREFERAREEEEFLLMAMLMLE